MKTSIRPSRVGESYTNQRENVPQPPITDTNHHVTEAIGVIYGGDDYSKRDSRSLILDSLTYDDPTEAEEFPFDTQGTSWTGSAVNNHVNTPNPPTSSAMSSSTRQSSLDSLKMSPSLSLREDVPKTQFPLNDIDYESDPADVAQALSNLQALRRMSMDVGNTSDPDLPSYQGASLMPSVAPTNKDDDPSTLFWVPARVHPELAPMEFKTFLENRFHLIKRQAGEQLPSLADGYERKGSSGSALKRRKSMLSTQIGNMAARSTGDTDGFEKSVKGRSKISDLNMIDLEELDTLVRDSSKAMRKLTLDTKSHGTGNVSSGEFEDIPILPQAPGVGLRRSTRTTYRRGSLRKGERVPLSKRAGSLRRGVDGEESISLPEARQPISPSESSVNEDSPQRSRRVYRSQNTPQTIVPNSTSEASVNDFTGRKEGPNSAVDTSNSSSTVIRPETPSKQGIRNQDARSEPLSRNTKFPPDEPPVPKIVQTPPPEQQAEKLSSEQLVQLPERSSSQTQPLLQQIMPPSDSSIRSSKCSISPNSHPAQIKGTSQQNSNEIVQSPSPSTGVVARSDSLISIPSLEVKKTEKKYRRDKDDPENQISRKTTWNWFKGGDEKEKKDKKKEDDREWRKNKKGPVEKSHDSARLDVLQSTLDTGTSRSRDGLSPDRGSLDPKSQDDRKKDSRKFSTEKKEKDSIFSSIFGGSKKKTDRDANGRKGSSLKTLSPEPHFRLLKPDVDYNWTRFSIPEERAIYRMAHIKLANPRRALYSQVLLSNFMYSYLAKVQQMHPHMLIPHLALQKKQEMGRRQKEQEQQALQQSQESEQYRYEYNQGIAEYAEGGQLNDKSERVNYIDDSQIYDYDHQENSSSHEQVVSNRPQSRASHHTSENEYGDRDQCRRHGSEFYSYGNQQSERDEDEMW